MRDEDRIDMMVELLRQVWHKYPDLRLGQLVTNAPHFDMYGELIEHNTPVFMVEDNKIQDGLIGLLAREETP